MASSHDIHSGFHARNVRQQPAPSFTYVLISNVAGLVVVLGLVLLGAMVWQAIGSTEKEARQEISETLNLVASRLQLLIRAAEMTVESAERVVRASELRGATIKPILESSLAAFEQRPELSYLGIALPGAGEYGALERAANGTIQLRTFPGIRIEDPLIQRFILTEKGFVLHEAYPTDGYDPRQRPFYQAALDDPDGSTWIPMYQWSAHFSDNELLWGFSYAKALRDSSGRVIGVLDTDLDMPALNRFLNSLAEEYRTRIQIVELGEILRLIGGAEVRRVPLPVPGEFASLLGFSGDIFVKQMEVQGERRWIAAKRIDLTGGLSWLVVVSRPAPFIGDALRQQLYQLLGIGVLIAAGLVMVLVRMARRFGRPLAELEQRVIRIEENKLDMSDADSVAIAGEFRETQRLGEALDRMILAIAQQVLAKEQQMASLALKGAIFDFTSAAIFSLNRQLSVIEWNAAAEHLFGVERDQVLGRTVSEIILAPEGPADWVAILGTKGTGTFRFLGGQGEFDAELRLVVVVQDGHEIHTLVINDISERKQAQARLLAFNAELEKRVAHRTAELVAANQELDSFCHSVSHDLRAPLRGIAGFAEIVVQHYGNGLDDKAKNYLERVLAATRRMEGLIDDLLQLSRISREEMRRDTIDLSAMANEILADLRESSPERQVETVVEDNLLAEGDPRLLRIMLQNLLGNAWKFTAKTLDARIVFAAEKGEDDTPSFFISDNGDGFDMRYANKLFSPFQRLHREADFPGTGIGLATVKRIVTRHGGHIWVHAEPGKGATFHFSLGQPAS